MFSVRPAYQRAVRTGSYGTLFVHETANGTVTQTHAEAAAIREDGIGRS